MKDTLSKIKEDIESRIYDPSSDKQVLDFSNEFSSNVINRAVSAYSSMIAAGTWDINDFNKDEYRLYNTEAGLTVISLKGFNHVVKQINSDTIAVIEIEANLLTSNKDIITITSTVYESLFQCGSEVYSSTLLFNGNVIDSFLSESDSEDALNSFITDNFLDQGNYDLNRKPLNMTEAILLSDILGIDRSKPQDNYKAYLVTLQVNDCDPQTDIVYSSDEYMAAEQCKSDILSGADWDEEPVIVVFSTSLLSTKLSNSSMQDGSTEP